MLFQWDHPQEEAFRKIQKAIVMAPIIRYFDKSLETVIQCDASSTGLGAALLQEGQPVAFASRTLSANERSYAQIEKELLAIVFAMSRFRQYLYGRRVVVDSDHKQLQSLSSISAQMIAVHVPTFSRI